MLKQALTNKYFLIILSIAILLRLLGIWHDYPFSFYPDEAHFVKRALAFGSGDLNPHWFHKPAFFMYVLFFIYGILFVLGYVFSLWEGITEFAVSFITNPGIFYISGRLTVVLFSLGTIVVTYMLCVRHLNRYIGLFAALFLAFSFGHIAASQDVKADIPASFFTILSIYYLLNYLQTNKRKEFWLAVICAGIGTATKLYPYVMLVPLGLAIVYQHWSAHQSVKENIKYGWKNIIVMATAMIAIFYATFFICSPYNFLDPLGLHATFGRIFSLLTSIGDIFGVEKEKTSIQFITESMSRSDAIISYLKAIVATNGLGLVIGILACIGSIYMLTRKSATYLFLFLFPIIFISISTFLYPGYSEPRHQLPIYPFLAIGAAFLIFKLNEKYQSKYIPVVFCCLLTFPLWDVVERGIFISKTDTRNIAKNWIEENLPNGAKVVIDENGPVLQTSVEQLSTQLKLAKQADSSGQFTANYDAYLEYQLLAAERYHSTFNLSEIRFPWWRASEPEDGIYELSEDDIDNGNPLRTIGVKTIEEYRAEGYQYIIVNSERYNPYFQEDAYRYKNFPRFRNFYHTLFEQGVIFKEFSPEEDNRPGPTIKIFKL